MQDNELKNVLRHVITSLGEKKASAEDLSAMLLKTAREKRLSGEQVHRMVNVLNVERALAMHSKAASDEERGADIGLIDAPALVARYLTEKEPSVKKANTIQKQKPSWRSYSVGDSLKSPPTDELLKSAGPLDDWQSSTPGLPKQASAPDPLAWMNDTHGLETLSSDYLGELRTVLTKIARKALPTIGYDTTPLLNEVVTMSPFVAEALGNHLRSSGYQVQTEKVAAVKFCVDTYRVGDLVQEADHLIHVSELCKAASFADKLEAALRGKGTFVDPTLPISTLINAPAGGSGGGGSGGGGGSDDEVADPADRDSDRDSESPRRNPPRETGGKSPLLYALEKGETPTAKNIQMPGRTDHAPALQGSTGNHEEGQSRLLAAMEALSASGSIIGQGGRTLGEGAKGLAETLTKPYAADSARSTTDLYASLMGNSLLNKQKGVADSVTRLKQQIVLTRLIKSDDIIRHAPPGEVVSMFNTIRNLNPAAAADINVVKLLLREALTNQGMPLSSVKSLNEVRPTDTKLPPKK